MQVIGQVVCTQVTPVSTNHNQAAYMKSDYYIFINIILIIVTRLICMHRLLELRFL